MESEWNIWQVALLALAAGVLIGVLAHRLFSKGAREVAQAEAELKEAQEALRSYRAEVDGHFAKTSELVNDLTQDYVRVYQHLADGVQTLGNGRSFNNLLEQQAGKVVLTVDDREPGEDSGKTDEAEDPAEAAATPPVYEAEGANVEAPAAAPDASDATQASPNPEIASEAVAVASSEPARDSSARKPPEAATESVAETPVEGETEAVASQDSPASNEAQETSEQEKTART